MNPVAELQTNLAIAAHTQTATAAQQGTLAAFTGLNIIHNAPRTQVDNEGAQRETQNDSVPHHLA